MSVSSRLTRRKKQVLGLLKDASPQGIATLNELRVRAMWADNGEVGAKSYYDHKKSFNRTLLQHSDPLEVILLADRWQGISDKLSCGIFARWAAWELIERGFTVALPAAKDFEFFMGRDACTAVIRNSVTPYAVIGNCCFLNKLHLVAHAFPLEQLKALGNVPWKILDSLGRELDPQMPVHHLSRLPKEITTVGGHVLTMSKIRPAIR